MRVLCEHRRADSMPRPRVSPPRETPRFPGASCESRCRESLAAPSTPRREAFRQNAAVSAPLEFWPCAFV
jgi:hypothetical protein